MYQYLFNNEDIMNVRLHTPCRALITPKAYPYFKLKSVLEILYYLLLLKVLKLLCNSYAKNENCVLLQLCLIFGSISKLVIVQAETPIFWPPHVKSWLIGKDPDAGRDWGQRRRGWQRMRWLDGITDSMDMSLSKSGSWWLTGRPGVLRFMGSQRVGHDWAAELNWWAKNGFYVFKVLFKEKRRT